jgi:MFS family permease
MNTLKPIAAFSLLCVACLTIMVGCVIVPGLNNIAAGLGVTGSASWLITLPALGVVIFGPLAGMLITRKGSRYALRIGLILYGALGVAGAWMPSPLFIYADRLLLGGATAIVMSTGIAMISEFYTGHARLKMMSKQGMAIELGGVIFLSVGGVLAQIGWRWPFALYLMGWVFLAMIEMFVPRQNTPVHEQASASDVPENTLSKVMIVYFAALLAMIIFFTAIIGLPFRLHGFGFNEAQIGYLLSFVSLVAVGAASTLPRLTVRIGESATLTIGFLCYAIAHLIFITSSGAGTIIFAAFILGFGFGLTVPLVNHMAVERSHAGNRGKVLAYLSMSIFLGQFMSSFLQYLPGGNRQTFAVAIALSIVGALIFGSKSLIKARTRRRTL